MAKKYSMFKRKRYPVEVAEQMRTVAKGVKAKKAKEKFDAAYQALRNKIIKIATLKRSVQGNLVYLISDDHYASVSFSKPLFFNPADLKKARRLIGARDFNKLFTKKEEFTPTSRLNTFLDAEHSGPEAQAARIILDALRFKEHQPRVRLVRLSDVDETQQKRLRRKVEKAEIAAEQNKDQ